MKSKILIGIFMCTLVLSRSAYADDKADKTYTVDEFNEKFQNLKEEYLDSVKEYFAKPDCELVELLGEEYEKGYNELANKTDGLSEEDLEKQLTERDKLIESNNNECYARKDLKAIVDAYNTTKAKLEQAAAATTQQTGDDGEAQEEQPAEQSS